MVNIVALKDMDDVPRVRIITDISKEHAITLDYQGENNKFKEFRDRL